MIAIDFREGAKAQRAGKGQYVYELCRALLELSRETHIVFFTHANQTVNLPAGNWSQRKFSDSPLLWHPQVIFHLIFNRSIKVYFATTSLIVPALAVGPKLVTTIFDFSVIHYASTHLKKAVRLERLALPLALRRSTHLLAISEATKQECIKLFRVPESKITVTPMAASPLFQSLHLSPEQISQLRTRYHLPEKFVLYLGTLEPRKNIHRLVSAWQQVKAEFPEYKLVLAGAKGWLENEPTDPDTILTGFVDDADRPALYSLATIFVFPSLYEGFGIPPLEAMSVGTPVITSNTSSLPEVVGPAALQVDPLSVDSIAIAMRQLLQDEQLRNQLKTAGLERPQLFSWSRTAQLTWEVLRRYV